jgi:hypothetical protein
MNGTGNGGSRKWLLPNSASQVTAVVLLGLLCYLPSLRLGFASDDFFHVEPRGLHEVLSQFSKNWGFGVALRPLATLSFQIDRFFSAEPWFFHTTNVVVHLLCSCAFYFVLRDWQKWAGLGTRWLPFLAAAFFVVQPVHEENVLWISGRTHVLGALFTLVALLSVGLSIWLSLCFLLIGLFCYETAATAPLLLVILYGWKSQKRNVVLMSSTVFVYIFYRWWVLGYSMGHLNVPVQNWIEPFSILPKLFESQFRGLEAGVLGLIALMLTALFEKPVLIRRWLKYLGSGTLLVLAGYLPFFLVSGFANRFMYTASLGGALLFAIVCCLIIESGGFRCNQLLALCVLVLLASGVQRIWRFVNEWQQVAAVGDTIVHEVSAMSIASSVDKLVVLDAWKYVRSTGYLEQRIAHVAGGRNVIVCNGFRSDPIELASFKPDEVIVVEYDSTQGRVMHLARDEYLGRSCR